MEAYVYNNKTYFNRDFLKYLFPNVSFPRNISDELLRSYNVTTIEYNTEEILKNKIKDFKHKKLQELDSLYDKAMNKKFTVILNDKSLVILYLNYITDLTSIINDCDSNDKEIGTIKDVNGNERTYTIEDLHLIHSKCLEEYNRIKNLMSKYKNDIEECKSVRDVKDLVVSFD